MMGYKTLLIGAAIFASAILGDYCNIKDRFIEPIRYKNVKIDSESYQKPFQLRKKYYVNEKGRLEVYTGYDGEWYKVDKDLRVNERGICEMLKEESKEVKPYVRKKVDDLIDWYERSFKNGNHN